MRLGFVLHARHCMLLQTHPELYCSLIAAIVEEAALTDSEQPIKVVRAAADTASPLGALLEPAGLARMLTSPLKPRSWPVASLRV